MPKQIKALPLDLQKWLPLYFDREADIDDAPSKEHSDTPLKEAIRGSSFYVNATTLLKEGANPNATGKFNSEHPLQVFFSDLLKEPNHFNRTTFGYVFMKGQSDEAVARAQAIGHDVGAKKANLVTAQTDFLELLIAKGLDLRTKIEWTDKDLEANPNQSYADRKYLLKFKGTVLDLILYFTKFYGLKKTYANHTDIPSHLARELSFKKVPFILKIVCAGIHKQMAAAALPASDAKAGDEGRRLKLADFSANGLSEAEWLAVRNIGALVVEESAAEEAKAGVDKGKDANATADAQAGADADKGRDAKAAGDGGSAGAAAAASAGAGAKPTGAPKDGESSRLQRLEELVRAQGEKIDLFNQCLLMLTKSVERLAGAGVSAGPASAAGPMPSAGPSAGASPGAGSASAGAAPSSAKGPDVTFAFRAASAQAGSAAAAAAAASGAAAATPTGSAAAHTPPAAGTSPM